MRQPIFGLAQGSVDLNDHDTLRPDLLRQTAVHCDTPLASLRKTPGRWILDFDATDDRVHGHQEGLFLQGHHGDHGFFRLRMRNECGWAGVDDVFGVGSQWLFGGEGGIAPGAGGDASLGAAQNRDVDRAQHAAAPAALE